MGTRPLGIVCIGFSVLLQACAALAPTEPPRVNVERVTWSPDEGRPRFAFELKVTNPGSRAMPLKGLAYSLQVDGVELVHGVANQLPEIEPYGEERVTLYATPNLLNGVRLLSRLATEPVEELAYRLEVTLDLGGLFPTQYVTEEGLLRISGR